MVLQITPEERAALQLLADGTTTDAMAGHLGTSEYEVEAYLTTLFAKMGAACRAEALAAAFRRGLLKGVSGTDEASLSRGTFRTE